MSERHAFLDAIRADPDEDAPRLIYADWLDERGEGRRAALIRFQTAAGRWGSRFQFRTKQLRAIMPPGVEPPSSRSPPSLERGFLDHMRTATAAECDRLLPHRDHDTLVHWQRPTPRRNSPSLGRLLAHPLVAACSRLDFWVGTPSELAELADVAPRLTARHVAVSMAAQAGTMPECRLPAVERLRVDTGAAGQEWALVRACPGVKALVAPVGTWTADEVRRQGVRLPALEDLWLDATGQLPSILGEVIASLGCPGVSAVRLAGERAWSEFVPPMAGDRRLGVLNLRLPPGGGDGFAANARLLRHLTRLELVQGRPEDAATAFARRDLWPELTQLQLSHDSGDADGPLLAGLAAGDLLPELSDLMVWPAGGSARRSGGGASALMRRLASGEPSRLERLSLNGLAATADELAGLSEVAAPLEYLSLGRPPDRPLGSDEVRRLAGSPWGRSARAVHFNDSLDEAGRRTAIDLFGPRCDADWLGD